MTISFPLAKTDDESNMHMNSWMFWAILTVLLMASAIANKYLMGWIFRSNTPQPKEGEDSEDLGEEIIEDLDAEYDSQGNAIDSSASTDGSRWSAWFTNPFASLKHDYKWMYINYISWISVLVILYAAAFVVYVTFGTNANEGVDGVDGVEGVNPNQIGQKPPLTEIWRMYNAFLIDNASLSSVTCWKYICTFMVINIAASLMIVESKNYVVLDEISNEKKKHLTLSTLDAINMWNTLCLSIVLVVFKTHLLTQTGLLPQ